MSLPLYALSEPVSLVGRSLRETQAEQQQNLIAGIRDGVKGLREHRRAARCGGADALQYGEARVSRQRRNDCRLRFCHRLY